jgi:hypothetical protein
MNKLTASTLATLASLLAGTRIAAAKAHLGLDPNRLFFGFHALSKIAAAVLALCVGATGCIAVGGSSEDDDRIVTVTAVHLRADGTQEIRETTMTLAQERAESMVRQQQLETGPAARAIGLGEVEQTIALDMSCFGASLWLYDASNNRICFSGAGTAFLNNYTDGAGNWAGQVDRYWPGSEAGYLYDRIHDVPLYVNFSAWQTLTTDPFGHSHNTLVLTN